MARTIDDHIRSVIKVLGPNAGVRTIGDHLVARGVFFDEEDIMRVLRIDFPR
jgi:hypothetical protein